MRVTSSAGRAELGKGCNEVDMDTTEGAQTNVCFLNKQCVSESNTGLRRTNHVRSVPSSRIRSLLCFCYLSC